MSIMHKNENDRFVGKDRFALHSLSGHEKLIYVGGIFSQIAVNSLDAIGIVILGQFLILIQTPDDSQNLKLGILNSILEGNTHQTNLEILLGLAGVAFVGKSILSLLLTKITLRVLLNASLRLSLTSATKFFNLNIEKTQKLNSQQTAFGLTYGMTSLVLENLNALSIILSECGLLLLLFALLLYKATVIALVMAVYFGILFVLVSRKIGKRVTLSTRLRIQEDIKASQLIQNLLFTYRDNYIYGGFPNALKKYHNYRKNAVTAASDLSYLSAIPKYSMEIGMIVGISLIAIIDFSLGQNSAAAGNLLIFGAASSRILPSLLRMQGALATRRTVREGSSYARDIIEELPREDSATSASAFRRINNTHSEEIAIKMENVSYSHEVSEFKIKDLNLRITSGEKIAIIGPSGGGKSTIIDLITGIKHPDAGEIAIRDRSPLQYLVDFPGGLGYIPQRPGFLPLSIAENIALGRSEIDLARIRYSLSRVGLLTHVDSLEASIHSQILEDSRNFSGGQLQRIAVARAFYFGSPILLLDEPTSALDNISDAELWEELLEEEALTILAVTHKLHNLERFDRIVLVIEGEIAAVGKFQELLQEASEFRSFLKNNV